MSDSEELSKKDITQILNPVRESQYTQDDIDEMKALGMPKPPEVSWGSWMGPKKESHVHEALIFMAAAGATNKKIAEELGFTQSRISIILSKPEIKKKIRAAQEMYWGENSDQRFKNLLPKAIDVAQSIIEDKTEKTSLKADVAFKLMDRALGKPQQSVSVEGNLLADLIHRLDQQDPRDVTQPELGSEGTKDKAEEFVDEFLGGEDFTVGKRDKNG